MYYAEEFRKLRESIFPDGEDRYNTMNDHGNEIIFTIKLINTSESFNTLILGTLEV